MVGEKAYRMDTISQFVGRELGVSDWKVVDQARIDQFAECTGDYQWIHVDAQRAADEGPFGNTIAHGFLCLSLIAVTQEDVGMVPADAAHALNYGLDRVRFLAPVRAGARVRNRVEVMAAETRGPGKVLLTTRNTLEIEGEEKPALVAEALVMIIA
jgi:acyl dehydratase